MTQTVSTESPMELSPRERLIRIMKREQALFIRQTLSQKPGYRGGKKAFEYFIRQKIVKAVEAGCGDAEALLRTPKPVKAIYYDFKYYFDEYSYANCDLYVEKAIEDCGKEDMPEDAERKGLGTPATRAAVIEKLVATGFAERKKAKKSVRLVPTEAGVSLITVLPEQLQSPLLTAEWEHRLKEIECGELGADEFLAGIRNMVAALVRDAAPVDGAEVLFPSGRPVVGKCPRCGAEVTESKNGYFCERRSCKFGLWRDNRFLAAKKISLTKKMASSLLAQGRAYASGVYSEKTGKTYDAFIVLEDDGARSSYKLDFTK